MEAAAATDTSAALARDLMKSFQRTAKPAKKNVTRNEKMAAAPTAVLDAPVGEDVSPPIVPLASTPISEIDTFANPVDVAMPIARVEEAAAPVISTAAKILAAREAAEDDRASERALHAATVDAPAIAAPAVESLWASELGVVEEPPAKPREYEETLAAVEETLLTATNLANAVAVSQKPSNAEVEAVAEASVAEAQDEAEPVGMIAYGAGEAVAAAAEAAPLESLRPAPAPLSAAMPPVAPARRESSATTFGNLQPTVMASNDWRRELTNRVEAYRARTGQGLEEEPAAGFPLESEAAASEAPLEAPADSLFETAPQTPLTAEPVAEAISSRASLRTASRNRAAAVEILSLQPEFDFAAAETDEHPHAPLVPVAEMSERRTAGVLDATFIVSAYLVFLVFFSSLGGKITFGKMELAIYGATFFLFYTQYFVLFTIFGCPTPGMQIRGLRPVNFDGTAPDARQLMLRSLGYVVSAGALLMGFLWSLWDEDHLTWHDRMSHTYLTHAAPQAQHQ